MPFVGFRFRMMVAGPKLAGRGKTGLVRGGQKIGHALHSVRSGRKKRYVLFFLFVHSAMKTFINGRFLVFGRGHWPGQQLVGEKF